MTDRPRSSSPHVAVIQTLFERYDQTALEGFRQVTAAAKSDGTTVTRIDLESSVLAIDVLSAHTPGYGIISEEAPEPLRPDAPWRWVIDPLDGTASFARGYPVWGLGIGLMHGDDPVEGYLRFPALNETFIFMDGELTFNGLLLPPPSGPPLLDTEHFLIDSSFHSFFDSFAPFRHIKLRSFGSTLYHLAALAAGRAEGMICSRACLWDLAAALPMTRAAGFVERYVDGGLFHLGDMTPDNGFKTRGPLLIAPEGEIETLVRDLQSVLKR